MTRSPVTIGDDATPHFLMPAVFNCPCPLNSTGMSCCHTSFPSDKFRHASFRYVLNTYTLSSAIVGVDRGLLPPWYSPAIVFPITVCHRGFPDFASYAKTPS